MAKNKRLDLTTGKPIKQILLFSLPLVMGSLFQQLYSFVDTIMVGRLISNDALTGMGYSAYSVFSGICELIGKCVGGLLAVKWFGFWGICVATPLAWFLAMVYCGILVRQFLSKRLKAAA